MPLNATSLLALTHHLKTHTQDLQENLSLVSATRCHHLPSFPAKPLKVSIFSLILACRPLFNPAGSHPYGSTGAAPTEKISPGDCNLKYIFQTAATEAANSLPATFPSVAPGTTLSLTWPTGPCHLLCHLQPSISVAGLSHSNSINYHLHLPPLGTDSLLNSRPMFPLAC